MPLGPVPTESVESDDDDFQDEDILTGERVAAEQDKFKLETRQLMREYFPQGNFDNPTYHQRLRLGSCKIRHTYFASFRTLRMTRLLHMQNKLIEYELMKRDWTEKDHQQVETLLREYTQAQKDYMWTGKQEWLYRSGKKHQSHMLEMIKYFPDNPMYKTGNGFSGNPMRFYKLNSGLPKSSNLPDPLRRGLKTTLGKILPERLITTAEEQNYKKHWRLLHSQPPMTISPFIDKLARFLIAIIAGATLVVPMLIMIFDKSETKNIITVSAAVAIFSLVLSFGIRTTNAETFVGTATYAAVLVVFLGANSDKE